MVNWDNLYKHKFIFPSLEEVGFVKSSIIVRDYDLTQISQYELLRNFPGADATSYLSPHLRFGT